MTCINIGHMGLLGRKAQLVRREDIMLFGIDSILTKDSDVIIESGKEVDISSMIRRESLHGRDVLTIGDTRVGKIQDVILDDAKQSSVQECGMAATSYFNSLNVYRFNITH